MKKILLLSIMFIMANAANYSGIYHKDDATIKVIDKNDKSETISFDIDLKKCTIEWTDSKFNIKGDTLLCTDDQGYGPMNMMKVKFGKNSIDVSFSSKFLTDYSCDIDTAADYKKITGIYKKK